IYTSDLDVRPVLELARFSMSFAKNLVHGGELVGIVHEPGENDGKGCKIEEPGMSGIISREHIIFKHITLPNDDIGLYVCATYPSSEDLKSLGITNLKPDELSAQATQFMNAFSRLLIQELDLEHVPLSTYTQSQALQFHETMMRLFDDVLHASQIIFTDEFPSRDARVPESNECQFLFASIMAGSIPLASRFFENMERYFAFTVETQDNVASILEQLIGAQLSTIISTGRSLANTAMRQVELVLDMPGDYAERLFINFHPIQGEYTFVLVAKGNPITLGFFLQATAEGLSSFDYFNKVFSGDISEFGNLPQFLSTIPRLVSFEEQGLELDGMVEDLDMEVVATSAKPAMRGESQELGADILDEQGKKYYKARKELLKLQREINRDLSEGKAKNASKKMKALLELATKTENLVLKYYYEEKLDRAGQLD
nr:hypothetical protein [Candidatus Sigynarchaeota archaeon]